MRPLDIQTIFFCPSINFEFCTPEQTKQIVNRWSPSRPTSQAITWLRRPTPSTGGFTGASRTPLRLWTPSWSPSGLPVETLPPRQCTELVISRHGKQIVGFLISNVSKAQNVKRIGIRRPFTFTLKLC